MHILARLKPGAAAISVMRKLTAVCLFTPLLLAGCTSTSCIGATQPPEPEVTTAPTADGGHSNPTNNPSGKIVYFTRYIIKSYAAPAGSISDSDNVWSFASQAKVRSASEGILQRNGMKVAVGTQRSLPELEKMLSVMAKKRHEDLQVVCPMQQSTELKVNSHDSTRAIFTFQPDQTASGADYPPGDYSIVLFTTKESQDSETLRVTAMPKIISAFRQKEYTLTGEKPSMEINAKEYPFNAMTFDVTVEKGGFILIGPCGSARKDNSAGKHFFISTKDGIDFENIFVIVPEIVPMVAKQDRRQDT